MKDIQQYVITIEQAKRLKELGVEQNSLYFWFQDTQHPIAMLIPYNQRFEEGFLREYLYSAFTSQELGELISEIHYFPWKQQILRKPTGDLHTTFHEIYEINEFIPDDVDIYNEAQARAEFLIHLLTKDKE